jgi:hypothetical protein
MPTVFADMKCPQRGSRTVTDIVPVGADRLAVPFSTSSVRACDSRKASSFENVSGASDRHPNSGRSRCVPVADADHRQRALVCHGHRPCDEYRGRGNTAGRRVRGVLRAGAVRARSGPAGGDTTGIEARGTASLSTLVTVRMMNSLRWYSGACNVTARRQSSVACRAL